MISPRYLDWALRFYPRDIEFDLATSGIRTVSASEWRPHLDVALDNMSVLAAYRSKLAQINDVPSSEVCATLGASHSISTAYAATLTPGDEILVEHPAYEPLLTNAQALSAKISRFPRRNENNFAIDPDDVKRAIRPETKLVVLTNLHNPSGVRTSDEVIASIANIAEQVGARVLVDEVYSPFEELLDNKGTLFARARQKSPNVIAISSLTKCFGLGPARIGWMSAPSQVIANAEKVLLTSVGFLPVVHAHYGIAAIDRLSELAARTKKHLGTKREVVSAFLAKREMSWTRAESGLFGFVHLPPEAARPKMPNVREAIERAVDEKNLIVTPGEFFEMPDGFRMGWSLPEEKIHSALARLDEFLSQYEV